jgi:hypothetical protein
MKNEVVRYKLAGRIFERTGDVLTVWSSWVTKAECVSIAVAQVGGFASAQLFLSVLGWCAWTWDMSLLAGWEIFCFKICPTGNIPPMPGAMTWAGILICTAFLWVGNLLWLILGAFVVWCDIVSESRTYCFDRRNKRWTIVKGLRLGFGIEDREYTIPKGAKIDIEYDPGAATSYVRLTGGNSLCCTDQQDVFFIRGYNNKARDLGFALATFFELPVVGPTSFEDRAKSQGVHILFKWAKYSALIGLLYAGIELVVWLLGIQLPWIGIK